MRQVHTHTHTEGHYATSRHTQHNVILSISLNQIICTNLSSSWPGSPQQSRRGFICCVLAWIANRAFSRHAVSFPVPICVWIRAYVCSPPTNAMPQGYVFRSLWPGFKQKAQRTVHEQHTETHTHAHTNRLYPSRDLWVSAHLLQKKPNSGQHQVLVNVFW